MAADEKATAWISFSNPSGLACVDLETRLVVGRAVGAVSCGSMVEMEGVYFNASKRESSLTLAVALGQTAHHTTTVYPTDSQGCKYQ